MTSRARRVAAVLVVLACVGLFACGGTVSILGSRKIARVKFAAAGAYLVIEVLDDELVHFELSAVGAGPDPDVPLYTTPMVSKTDYAGPRRFADNGHGVLETAALRLTVDTQSLCMTVADTTRTPAVTLTTLCPGALGTAAQSLTLTPNGTQHVYGLGEHFLTPGAPNGDWFGKTVLPGNADGNALTPFDGGNTGNAQFPVMYALGAAGQSYALFLDHLYAQAWDFTSDPWTVQTSGAQLRGYVLAGANLPALRSRYMDLVGHPPVPPKKMFGLWVSEFGYDSWTELEGKLQGLRTDRFPVDGFMMDLQWFGGVFRSPSEMGALTWDTTHFPDPAGEIARLRDTQGVGLMVIEEPYVVKSRPEYAALAAQGYLARTCDGCDPAVLSDFWGTGGMLDWSDDDAGDFWHDAKRQPLIDMGVLGHWTDLGEPEVYDSTAWYYGFPQLGLHAHADIHNLYNFAWLASIARGYARHGAAQRPFMVSRSGTSGIQRFGAAMWSGDIGSNLDSLAAHFNAQMHMSFSGVDYFGADIGGYYRSALQGESLTDVYTQWFADGMLLDVPGRPHTFNLCNCNQTAPDRVGDVPSNLANLRLRYQLIPYLYSLAHCAYRYGEPVVPPPVFYYQDDANLQQMGDEKLLGRDLLVATSSTAGQTARDVYLPRGTWINYHTNAWVDSGGAWLYGVPLAADGLFQLPLFVRSGAIIPEMYVDEQTMNALGKRLDGSVHDELIVRVYADATPSQFTVYEDDGVTTAYQQGAVRTTVISQQRSGATILVRIEPASGTYDGAAASRDNIVQVIARDATAVGVSLNGAALPRQSADVQPDASTSGWTVADGAIIATSGPRDVHTRTVFEITLQAP
ncbi:MAG TPA: TIM-barrel domain-containing protein [Candidatus Acidoferrales bacterium]|nr:TIM-barrel domain-containing protein [Candidatus Acidoferrales bacterium]